FFAGDQCRRHRCCAGCRASAPQPRSGRAVNAARLAYTALVYAALPLALLRLAWRARRESGYAEHIGERFGRYAAHASTAPLIWIHAVSVGETRAAEPLVRALGERYPGYRLLLTHMTPTG